VKSVDVFALGAMAGTVAITALLYGQLPETVATHWGADGVANGFMPRAAAASFGPGFALALWLFMRLGVPRLARAATTSGVLPLIAAGTSTFVLATHGVILYAAVHGSVGPAMPFLAVAMGGLSLLLGLLMPRVRKNPFVGVRTYWTLSSDENWARTHRFAGYAFVGAALISFCGTAASGVRSVLVAGVAMGLAGVASAVFSYVIARRTPQR
jgi:uncharacterized membrane protein